MYIFSTQLSVSGGEAHKRMSRSTGNPRALKRNLCVSKSRHMGEGLQRKLNESLNQKKLNTQITFNAAESGDLPQERPDWEPWTGQEHRYEEMAH